MRHRNPIRPAAPAHLRMGELMIVNPVRDGIEERIFLGADGRLYRAKRSAGPCLRCAGRGRRIRNF